MYAKKVTAFGKEFSSLIEVCKYYNVSDATVRDRMKRGMSLEEALINKKSSKIPKITVFNKNFASILEASSYYGVAYTAVIERISKGMPLEEALSYKLKYGVTVFGKEFPSKVKACEYYGVKVATINYRMKNSGLSLEEAISLCNGVSVEGKKFKTIKDACIYHDVKPQSVAKKMQEGMTVEEAILYLKNLYVSYKDKKYSSVSAICKEEDVAVEGVLRRVRKGMSLEEAVLEVKKIQSDKVIVGGYSFRSKTQAVEFFGVSAAAVYGRTAKKGMSFEEAIRVDNVNLTPINPDVLKLKPSSGKNTKYENVLLNGKLYNSLEQVCSQLAVNSRVVRGRLQRGLSLEEAVGLKMVFPDRVGVNKVNYTLNVGRGIRIVEVIDANYCKCDVNGKVRYFSKDELSVIRRKAFENGERF